MRRGRAAGRGAGDRRLSPFFAIAHLGLGHAAYVTGELNLATEMLSTANLSEAAPAIVRVLGLSVQSLAEGELGRHERSRELAERAMEIVDARQLHVMPQAALAFAALGQVQASLGKVSDAMATLEQGLAMRRRHPIGQWAPIHHVMVMARVAVQAGEVSMAQELLSEPVGSHDPLPGRDGGNAGTAGGHRGGTPGEHRRRGRRGAAHRDGSSTYSSCSRAR